MRRTGQYHPQAKLSAQDIEMIFKLREQGLSLIQIARKMECSRTYVYYVLKGLRRPYG